MSSICFLPNVTIQTLSEFQKSCSVTFSIEEQKMTSEVWQPITHNLTIHKNTCSLHHRLLHTLFLSPSCLLFFRTHYVYTLHTLCTHYTHYTHTTPNTYTQYSTVNKVHCIFTCTRTLVRTENPRTTMRTVEAQWMLQNHMENSRNTWRTPEQWGF